VTTLRFSEGQYKGRLDWVGLSHSTQVLAAGSVDVPDDRLVHLFVRRASGRAEIGGGRVASVLRPVDLTFLRELPPDAIGALNVQGTILPETFDAVTKLASGLRHLNLGDTELEDSAVPVIGELTRLTHLGSYGNRFTDAGLQQLVSLRELQHLSFEEASLTVAALAFAADLPSLVSLEVWDMQITDEEHAVLRAELPGVAVGPNGSGP
jgi:hypothetical protein